MDQEELEAMRLDELYREKYDVLELLVDRKTKDVQERDEKIELLELEMKKKIEEVEEGNRQIEAWKSARSRHAVETYKASSKVKREHKQEIKKLKAEFRRERRKLIRMVEMADKDYEWARNLSEYWERSSNEMQRNWKKAESQARAWRHEVEECREIRLEESIRECETSSSESED